MKKVTLVIIVLLFIGIAVFKNLGFNTNAIFKIEEQRREHNIFLKEHSNLLHNKATYFIYQTLDFLLEVFSPVFVIVIFIILIKKEDL